MSPPTLIGKIEPEPRSDPDHRKVQTLKPSESQTIEPVSAPEEVHPDVALVERARAGDVHAFETLVKQYDRQVFRIAHLHDSA